MQTRSRETRRDEPRGGSVREAENRVSVPTHNVISLNVNNTDVRLNVALVEVRNAMEVLSPPGILEVTK